VGRGLLAALALLPLASASASAQESVFALQFLGVSEETGDGRARSLGVLGVGLDETRTAIVLNPATLGGANHMSLSVMAVAGSRETTDMDSQQRFGMARFPQLRGALPLFGKVVFTTGFMAMRNFRGEFTLEPDQIDDLTYAQRFERDGTLYVVPVGLAGSLGPLLRVGATADFMLGTIDEAWITEGESLLPLSSRRRDRLSGITATLGVLLQPTPWLELGATYSPEFDVQRERRETLESAAPGGSSSTPFRDATANSTFRFPKVWRLGASVRLGSRLLLSGDYLWRQWEAYGGSSYEAEKVGDEIRAGGGVELNPNGRVAFRVGGSRWTWPQYVGGERLRETTLHLGVGIAIHPDMGRLDLALEHAWIGDLERNGLQERSFRVVVSISGQEEWKRKSPRSE
jgi:hypothetical protein